MEEHRTFERLHIRFLYFKSLLNFLEHCKNSTIEGKHGRHPWHIFKEIKKFRTSPSIQWQGQQLVCPSEDDTL